MSALRFIALHGFTGSGADFDGLRAHVPANWQWHCPDLPGHGINPITPRDGQFSLEQHLDFLEGERHRFTGDTACVLLGYSMGGRLALHWALHRPKAFSALILIGASPGLADDTARAARACDDEALATSLPVQGIARFLDIWWQNSLFAGLRQLPSDDYLALRQRRLNNDPVRLAASLRGVGTGTLPSLWEKLPQVSLPVLCLAGAEDKKFAGIAQAMSSRLPNGTAACIDGTYHLPHLENPPATGVVLTNFLRAHH